MLQDLEAAHAVGYNGYQGTVTEITGDNRLKVAFDAGGPQWPTVNPANLKPLCGFPPAMPKSCAAGLPGFDPSGFACNGDCSKAVRDAMNPKFSFGKGFSLGKIKNKLGRRRGLPWHNGTRYLNSVEQRRRRRRRLRRAPEERVFALVVRAD